MFSPPVLSAAADYLLLLDKAYPERPSLQLVGDRYRLSREERMMLFRGVAATRRSLERRKKLCPNPVSEELHLDGYNVLFTILNYREGRKVFVATDGFLRDAGGAHGRIAAPELFFEVLRDLLGFLASRGVKRPLFYLDSPVSHSAEHAARLREELARAGLEGGAELFESADFGLKRAKPACAATSDTAIIDALEGPVWDCARAFLETRYGAEFPEFPSGGLPAIL